jgi:hypothetical protein
VALSSFAIELRRFENRVSRRLQARTVSWAAAVSRRAWVSISAEVPRNQIRIHRLRGEFVENLQFLGKPDLRYGASERFWLCL